MQPSDRRAFLETIVETAESEQARLKALELLDRLDERENVWQGGSEPGELAAELAEQPEKLYRLIELADEHLFADLPAYRERVERRAQEIVEEQARARRGEMAVLGVEDPQDGPEGEEAIEEPSESTEALSGPENAEERLTDERVLHWPRRERPREFGGRPPSLPHSY